ncbi:MAG: hypothetical protein KJ042_16010, partial [Deltaproteobacteria bacterium]|nr:hypothetical protein [Deltaproteobacteria bacterium]
MRSSTEPHAHGVSFLTGWMMHYRRFAGVLIATGLALAAAGAASAEGLLDKNLHYFAPPVDNSGLIVS